MDSKENPDSGLELPAAKKICLDNNDVSNTFRNNSSLSDSTLHLGDLFSPRQSFSSCSINDKDDTSTVSSPLQRNQTSFENNKSANEDENKVSIFSSVLIDDKSGCSTALTDLNEAPECVAIIENDNKNCSLSEFNPSLSQKAFNIEESLDFMDETCFESHSGNDSNVNIVTNDMDSPKILDSGDIKKDENISVHDESSITEDSINLTKKSDTNCSNKLDVTLDYTCKPDVMGEETSVLCHSTIKKDAMLPNYKLFSDPSSTAMSIDESLMNNINNTPCQLKEEASSHLLLKKASIGGIDFEDSDCEKQCDNSNSSNLFNEVSGCALDYTCSKSVEYDVDGTFTEISLTNKANETNISVILECSHNKEEVIKTPDSVITKFEDLTTESNMKMEHKNILNLNENNVSNVEHLVNDLYDLSDLKNSFMSNKTFSAEEVNFLKENLLKVMELLKNDNNSFESYKLASECEKRELVEKIKHLESNLTKNFGSCEHILVSGKTVLEEETGHYGSNNIVCEELSKSREQYNNLLQLVLVTESNWMENKLFVDFLSHLNLAHNDLFIPITKGGKEYIINHKKIYDLMLTFAKEVFKTHLFKEECNHILKTFLESCKMNTDQLHFILKEGDPNLVENLKVTFEEIINLKNGLENENAELKKEVCNKSDEIKMLTSTIENLNQQLNIFKETADICSNKIVEDKYSNVSETIQHLSLEVTEKIFHDNLDKSVTDVKDLCSVSENTFLSPSKNDYSNISSKCTECENVSQKMSEVEQVYQELLLRHDVLKTEFDSKCCEIEKLNLENQILIEKIDYLKCQYDIKDDKNDKTEPSSSGQHEGSCNEIVCFNKTGQDLSFKIVENSLLFNDKDKLKNGPEMSQNNLSMEENLVELQRNFDCLEAPGSSSENEGLKFQSDLNRMNEQYFEILSKFDLYKQTYTYTEDEYNSWKEEKQSLQCALDSLKDQLETALEESSKLTPNDEIQYKIESLLAQLSDLETTNANLKTQLSDLQGVSDQNIDSLSKEISELKIKLDSAEKLLMDYENQLSELKASNKKICEDLESKNSDLLLITGSKEKLEKELEMYNQNDESLKQRIEELLENRNSLEAQFLSSNDKVSQLQGDLDCLNEKYSEVLNNFDLLKNTHAYTEDEYTSVKEEKQSLENTLNSLKTQLEAVCKECSELKSDNLVIHEENENLLAKLTDLETCNANLEDINAKLQTQLNGLHCDTDHNLDFLNTENSELKLKLDSAEKLLLEHEKQHSELKASYKEIYEDLQSKNLDFSLLTDSKDNLEKELEIVRQNDALLQQKIEELLENRNSLEAQFLSSKDEVSRLQINLDCLNEKYSEVLNNFDLLKKTHAFTEDEYTSVKEEKQSLESALDSLQSQLETLLEESSKLKYNNGEIKNYFKNIEDELCDEKLSKRDVQNSYENLKIKYVELFVKINMKTKEMQNIMAKLYDLETKNANLKNEFNRLHDDSEKKIDLLNKEAFELKRKCEISEKSLIDLQEKQNEITLSYNKTCVDLESKKSEILLISNSKEQLEKEIELLKQNEILLRQKIVGLEKDRNDAELQYHSSNDQVSKLQLDFNGLDEKYSEILSEFDLYKNTYKVTEDDYNLLKEEKHSLECALDSFKSQVESAHEESSKLKSDNEEINNNLKNVENQLYNEIENRKDIVNNFENLKTKYEESVIEINNKTTELNNLMVQLSDLETTNASLKTELTNFYNNSDINADLLNNEIRELKVKCDSTEKLLFDQEKKYSELKISYDKICEDLKSKSAELSSVSDSEEKLKKELEIFFQNDLLLKQRIEELQENRNCLDTQLLLSKEEVSKLQLDFKGLEEKYSEILTEFDLYKKTFMITEDECNLWKEEKQSLNSELDSIKSQLENALEESSKLKFDNEEMNKNVKNIEDQLNNEKQYSRDIQNCNNDLKTKYEESIVEINNKTIELKNLLAKLADLETVNGNLKDELSRLHSDSEKNIGLINEEVLELKRKCEASENLLIDHKQKYEELKVSYEKMSEDLESKNAELSLLTACKEKLENELELLNRDHTLLKQKIIELQEDRECLEVRFHSSTAEVSNLQFELDCLKEKYSKMVSDFSIYKEQFTRTEDECISLNQEKQLLKSESDSLKSKLECVHEELKKLKFDYEESNTNLNNVESQLCDEKKNCRDIQNLFDNLKIKYEESVSVINSKAVEIKNLLGQLTDLESINMNLKSELNVIRHDSEHDIELLNQKILELKDKYENSEKLRVDLEQKHDELKVSYNKSCEDFELKNMELSLLTDCKEQLEKEMDTLSQNNLCLKEKLKDLEINAEGYHKTLSDLNIQLDSANSKIDLMKNIETKVSALNNNDVLSSYHTKDMDMCGNQPFSLFSEFFNAVEAVIKDLILFKEKCSAEETKLSCCQEEVSHLNILLDSLKGELKLSTEECSRLQESYSSLSKQYSNLLETNKDSNIRCNSLLEKLKDLESQISICKSEIQNLKSEITTKDSIIADMSSVKDLYESTVKENEDLSSQLMEKIKECENALGEVKSFEQKYLSLKLEFNSLTNEINDLRSKNETLETKCNENYSLYINCKENMEILLKEKEEIRKNFIKCEKENQNSLDLVKKFQENMGNLDKQYNLSIAKLNEIVKEKESYESQNLSLQKTNDELLKRIKELNLKIQENQGILMKLKELEESYETLSCKHQCMEKQFIDYGNLKKENEILKSRVSEKESLSNNLSINYNTLNEKYNMLSSELQTLSSAVMALVPEENSVMEIINVVGEKLKAQNKMEKDLEEEKMKCENLDEECNLLNEDLKYKDVVIGDMYKDHSSQMNELKDLLKKEENLRQEILLENSTLKDKIKCLDSEIIKLKTTEPSPCSSCAELKGVLQKLKMDLVDNSSKVTTLQLQIEENEITHKKKIHDYRKKVSTLQEELGAALNKLEDNRLKNEIACLDASIQTESLPVQMSGQSGIVQSFKIKEQEEKIKKIEKENLVLKRMCQSRLQTIQELKSNLENVSKPQKTQRNALEEVQNHQSS